jgi:hypothetical protein
MSEQPPPIEVGVPRPEGLPRDPGRARAAAGLPLAQRVLGVLGRGWRTLSPRTRWILVATVVVSVLLAWGGYRFVLWVGYTPEKPVEELAEALRDGDLDRAMGLAACSGRLCRPGALSEGYERPSGLTVVAVSGDMSADTADVSVRYDLAGERRTGTIRVKRPGGGPLGDWRIVAGATGALDPVSASAKELRVAAVSVPARRPSAARASVSALFGVYTVAGDESDPLMAAEPVKVPVPGVLGRSGSATVVQPALTVRDAARREVEAQVKARVDGCAALPDFSPRGCPFAYPRGELYELKASQITWKVEAYPTVELSVVATASPVAVRTTSKGRASVTFVYDGAVTEPVSVEITVGGSVSVVDGKVVWSG